MKPDEKALLMLAAKRHGGAFKVSGAVPFIDAIAAEIGMNEKRAVGLAEKWDRKGWWDSGVTTRSGWFTEAGFAFASSLTSDF